MPLCKKLSYFFLFFFNVFHRSYCMRKRQTPRKYILICGTINYISSRTIKIAQYPVAAGKDETPTPIGQFHIIKKQKDWGSGFGTRWMELDVPWGNMASMVQIPLIQLVKVRAMDVFVCIIKMLKNCMPKFLLIHTLL